MADVSVAESRIHGLGVFAARDFVKDEVVLTIDDSRIVDEDHLLRPELAEHEHHCDIIAGGVVFLMQEPERYINSSCDPNTYVKTVDGVRRVLALEDIEIG